MQLRKIAGFTTKMIAIMALVLSACTPEEGSDDPQTEPENLWSAEDIEWEYTPFPSAVTADECDSLDSATLSVEEASAYQAVLVSFDCVIDQTKLSLTLGDSALSLVQISPTLLSFLVPASLAVGELTLEASGDYGARDWSFAVIQGPETPEDPAAYLEEFLALQQELILEITDLPLRERAELLLADAREALSAGAEEELREAADVIFANEEILGLTDKVRCQEHLENPERWSRCYWNRVMMWISSSVASVAVVLGGYGSIVSLGGAIALYYNLYKMLSEMIDMDGQAIQVAGSDSIRSEMPKSEEVESGQAFSIEVTANYLSFSMATFGPDASLLVFYLSEVNKVRDLIQRANEMFGLGLEVYGGENAHQAIFDVDPEYLSLRLAPDVDPAISISTSGMEVTLRNSSSDPLPATLIVTYNFPGVRTVETTFDVVVNAASFELTGIWHLKIYVDDTRAELYQIDEIDFQSGAGDVGIHVRSYSANTGEWTDRSGSGWTWSQWFSPDTMTLSLKLDPLDIFSRYYYDPQDPTFLVGEWVFYDNDGLNRELVKQ